MKTSIILSTLMTSLICLCSCKEEPRLIETPENTIPPLTLQGTAALFSSLGIGTEQMKEVSDAVLSSASNGYDEEYMLSDLFASPGAGVGEVSTRAETLYEKPLREMIRERLSSAPGARASNEVEDYIEALSLSGMQIYWPDCESWDGKTLPVITFDPESEAEVNEGYELFIDEEGKTGKRRVMVSEQMARERPVWVINCNDDSSFLTLEQLRRDDPDWGRGGRVTTRSGTLRTLFLKDFTMNRYYESWFRGASEFAVKCGSLEGFTASTEAELRLYQPAVTDFVISVKRKNVGIKQDFDVVLISDWTQQLESFAFMIVEDDGGTRTSWKCDATVKVQSKSYGITLDLPYNDKDDIVWRGSLSSKYFEEYSLKTSHFGGVDVTFDIR